MNQHKDYIHSYKQEKIHIYILNLFHQDGLTKAVNIIKPNVMAHIDNGTNTRHGRVYKLTRIRKHETCRNKTFKKKIKNLYTQ